MSDARRNYVVVEGCDGVGKTTMLKALAKSLMDDGHCFQLTKEPGGPRALSQEWNCSSFDYPFGAMYDGFRELCVNNPQIPQLAKRALYKADSFYNWLAVTKPAMDLGLTVISDRSWVSDIAYGAALAGVSAEALFQFNTALVPEQAALTRVIYLDCPEDVREARLAVNIMDHADKIGIEARRRICQEYRKVLDKHIYDYVVIDTNQPLENIVKAAKEFVYVNCTK